MSELGFDYEAVGIGVGFIDASQFGKQGCVFRGCCIADGGSSMTSGKCVITFGVLSDMGVADNAAIVGRDCRQKGKHFMGGFVGCMSEDYGQDWAWADVALGNPSK